MIWKFRGSVVPIVLLVGILTGCTPGDTTWTKSYDFPGNTWHSDNHIQMKPDTLDLQDNNSDAALLTLRYAAGASKRVFPLVVETECPGTGLYRCDTIRESLLDSESRTGDNSNFGVFEKTDTIRLKQKPHPGWCMTISQASADEEINGIFSITLSLIDSKKK